MRLVDADALNTMFCQECIGECACCPNALGDIVHMHCKLINEAPTLDAELVVHAKWEFVDREAFWIGDHEIWMKTGEPTIRQMPVCSHCKTEFGIAVLSYKRCPECGAKMDLDKDKRSEENQ